MESTRSRAEGPGLTRREIVLRVFAASASSLTADEVEQILGWTHGQTSARVFELHARTRQIVATGELRPTRKGRPQKAYRLAGYS